MDDMITATRAAVLDQLGFELTDEALQIVLGSNAWVRDEVERGCAGDTDVREAIADALSHLVLAERAPTYGDLYERRTPDQTVEELADEYLARLRQAVADRGWLAGQSETQEGWEDIVAELRRYGDPDYTGPARVHGEDGQPLLFAHQEPRPDSRRTLTQDDWAEAVRVLTEFEALPVTLVNPPPVEVPFWLSWYHKREYGPFELATPWWVSGRRLSDGADTIVAAVMATDENAAREVVQRSFDHPMHGDQTIEFRFVTEQEPGWSPFSDRFERCYWMEWPTESEQ